MSPGPLVLLVDDYADTRELYGFYLRMQGYGVEEAEDGIDGVAKAVALRPAAIVMDLAMPNMNGWEATRILKADPRTRTIPVICLTAHAHPKERESALDAGCDVFLTKPRLPAEVGAAIASVLGGGGAPVQPVA